MNLKKKYRSIKLWSIIINKESDYENVDNYDYNDIV